MANWVPLCLSIKFLTAYLIFVLAAIGALEAINRVSNANNGLKTINTQKLSEFVHGISLDSSFKTIFAGLDRGVFFYGFIATLVANIINLVWAGVLGELLNRQPYIELGKRDGATARQSIALDYPDKILPKKFKALIANGHFYCVFVLLIGLIINFIVSPLAASLFISLPFQFTKAATMIQTSTFLGDLNFSQVYVGDVINLAASILAYDTSPQTWSDADFAFDHFDISPRSLNSTLLKGADVWTAEVKAYGATLSCRTLTDYSTSSLNGVYSYTGIDRGCNVTSTLPMAGKGIAAYSSYTTCPSGSSGHLSSADSTLRRIKFIVAGYQSSGVPTNVSIFSCIPYYTLTSALVTINGTNFDLLSYILTNDTTDLQQTFTTAVGFEHQLPLIYVINPSATTSTDGYGSLLIQYMRATGQDIFEPKALLSVLSQTYATIFSQTVTAFLTQTSNGVTIDGTITTNVLRLCTYSLVVRILEALLVIVALTTLSALIYPHYRRVEIDASGASILDRAVILRSCVWVNHDLTPEGRKIIKKDIQQRYVLKNGQVRLG